MRQPKVPAVTAFFWAIKLLSTALGEATSDYLVHTVNPYVAVIGGFVGFAAALALQFATRAYRPFVYWLAVVMVAIFGTMAADVLHIQFGVPYTASTVAFAVVLAVVFGAWRASEGTLDFKRIVTPRRELFYWAAVLATFAMGTALGDLAAYTLHLGFLSAGVVFAVLFALPAFAYRLLGANAILSFWAAYVVTRPLGASFADWTGKARTAGGLGIGDGTVAAVLTLAIVVLVVHLARTKKDRQAVAATPALESA